MHWLWCRFGPKWWSLKKFKKAFTKGATLPQIQHSCQFRSDLRDELVSCLSRHVIMFPLCSPCCNCIISILFPSNFLIGLWGRKVLNEAFRWWEKQQTSKWQLPMMHGFWAKQRCSCMQRNSFMEHSSPFQPSFQIRKEDASSILNALLSILSGLTHS